MKSFWKYILSLECTTSMISMFLIPVLKWFFIFLGQYSHSSNITKKQKPIKISAFEQFGMVFYYYRRKKRTTKWMHFYFVSVICKLYSYSVSVRVIAFLFPHFVVKYESHTRVHTGEKPLQCDICLQCYSTKSNLTVHKKKHDPDSPVQRKEHKCPFCNKLHASKKTLSRHVKRCASQNLSTAYPAHIPHRKERNVILHLENRAYSIKIAFALRR